jgi:L-ribulose-5-phosphate 4-epimerase
MSKYKTLKEEAWEANRRLCDSGLVVLTFGNVSALDPKRSVFAIKPSGIPYDRLCANDMVVVDLENRIIEGKLRPSSDTKTHSVLYRSIPTIGGVCHTHSPYATAWAQAMKSIPILGTTHADYLDKEIPCTPVMTDPAVEGDYEEETGLLIMRTLTDSACDKTQMILVACHGPFAWGRSGGEAVDMSIVLEHVAKTALLTLAIHGETPSLKQSLIDRHYLRKHGKDAYYGQESMDDDPDLPQRTG